ncbi:S8 family peptidase [Pendulispora brunnea]|uniref:S8 family peptidase n=1 Tax=Pendulispora brunnea TaxID=2905690 RepID=A0ABZ2K535_9BACT
MRRKYIGVVASCAVLTAVMLAAAGCASDEDEPAPAAGSQEEPLEERGILLGAEGEIVPERYIVTLRDDIGEALSSTVDNLLAQYGGRIGFRYTDALKGFSVEMPEFAARLLAANPLVSSVSHVHIGHGVTTQQNPPWGLDRSDQSDLPLSTSYTYPDNGGQGVTAYLVDSGVTRRHPDFENRVTSGYDFVDDDDEANDGHGHGTHTAGTVLSKTYGIAKKARGVALRVLGNDNSGTTEQSLNAFDWIIRHAQKPAVLNYSIGFSGGDSAIDNAARRVWQAGIVFVVSAGNNNKDGCRSASPARVTDLITVGATTRSDSRARPQDWGSGSGSNFGACLDIFAPGTGTVSTSSSGSGTRTMYGTSMATPHVTGAAALYLATNPSATPQQVRNALVNNATAKVTNAGANTTNKLLYMGFIR